MDVAYGRGNRVALLPVNHRAVASQKCELLYKDMLDISFPDKKTRHQVAISRPFGDKNTRSIIKKLNKTEKIFGFPA
ncbi:hypothetical protein [Marinimicrobium sp. LS-A18]|uniref:hypothetical protein n=1 Tax=Marinimicrobium sp. LS-A18 TaxID=1381596 RepID=UPI00187C729B|nr:hypothetical protein [Marinimicrobium sp. LS-A18]